MSTNVDAYASRIAANCEPFPDPRDFVPAGESERLILISGPVDGDLRIGEDLLTQGDVLVGDVPVASAGDLLSAQFVHSVLLHDPELTTVPVPDDDRVLAKTMDEWDAASKKWRADFDAVQKRVAGAVADDRMKRQTRQRALALLHGV